MGQIIEVKLKKVHPSWLILYPDDFAVGDILYLENKKVMTMNGNIFSADEMCKSYGCAYSDIFEKFKE